MNKVDLRHAWLVLGRVTVLQKSIQSWYIICQLVQLGLRPSGIAKTSTSFAGVKAGTAAGWQVTLCDLIWHVSSHGGEASCKLLHSVYCIFLYFTIRSTNRFFLDGSIKYHCYSLQCDSFQNGDGRVNFFDFVNNIVDCFL